MGHDDKLYRVQTEVVKPEEEYSQYYNYECSYDEIFSNVVLSQVCRKMDYLKDQGRNNHRANVSININSMTPDLLKQMMHAVSRMNEIAFWSTPEIKRRFDLLAK